MFGPDSKALGVCICVCGGGSGGGYIHVGVGGVCVYVCAIMNVCVYGS